MAKGDQDKSLEELEAEIARVRQNYHTMLGMVGVIKGDQAKQKAHAALDLVMARITELSQLIDEKGKNK